MASQNRGIIKTAQGKAVLKPIPVPKLRDDYILVKTAAVAINPTDWQTLDETFKPGTTHTLLGCDAAGVVVEVGKNVTRDFKPGDRIVGMAHGGNEIEPEDGAFAEYIMIKGDIAMHIPPNLSFEEASTLSCGIATVALALYRYFELPLLNFPVEKKSDGRYILIYGGSTATGSLAIQLAKLSGLTVISTSSPHNFELLKGLGADHVFDYRDPECGPKIRSLTSDNLTLALDTIATTSSAQICADAITSSSNVGTYIELMDIKPPRADVRHIFFLGYTVSGEAFEIEGDTWPAVPEDFELMKRFAIVTKKLLEAELVKPHPAKVRDGLENILSGVQESKEGKVSGVKLVYRI